MFVYDVIALIPYKSVSTYSVLQLHIKWTVMLMSLCSFVLFM